MDDCLKRHPRIRVAGVAVRGESVLLVRHVREEATYWLLPGGGVDYGESLSDALHREFREETNLDIDPGALLFVHDSIAPDGDRHVVNLYFTVRILGGEVKCGEDERLAEARFVPRHELDRVVFLPDIREPLIRLMDCSVPDRPAYWGNFWSEWKPECG